MKRGFCWFGHSSKSFPTFWIIVLVLAAVWFANESGWVAITFPWFPAILVIVAIGAIVDHYNR